MLDLHDGVIRPRRALLLAAIAVLFFAPVAADAACNPASCDGFFACGFRECVGSSCVTFPDEAGTVCRGAAGVCDRAETCNGNSLSCPSDSKRGTTAVCRAAVDECDGAETCDGVSNDCTAPDVGIAPLITRVTILDGSVRFPSGGTNVNRFFEFRISGLDLCEATVEGAPFSEPLELSSNESGTALDRTVLEHVENPFPSSTYQFDINRGAVTGSLPYVAFDPDGAVEIPSPASGATLDGDPTFTVSNQCTNCGILELEILDDVSVGTIATMFTTLPIDTPLEIPLGLFSKGLAPLPESRYVFEAEAIAGSLVGGTFAGDPLQSEFNYVSGRSIRNRLIFNVPEPGLAGAGVAAIIALLAIGKLRGSLPPRVPDSARARARGRRRRAAPGFPAGSPPAARGAGRGGRRRRERVTARVRRAAAT
jgi:hypothetical protein